MTRGVPVAPLFRTQVKNLLSTAVNRGDLQGLQYTKTIYSRGPASDPAMVSKYNTILKQNVLRGKFVSTIKGELTTSPHLLVGWGGVTPHFHVLLPVNCCPHFLDQSYAPALVFQSTSQKLKIWIKRKQKRLVVTKVHSTALGFDLDRQLSCSKTANVATDSRIC